MKTIRTIRELREAVRERRAAGLGQVGFVPTMGYLHEGHASLIRQARAASGTVVVSIFVNPLQFGPNEDYEAYPRNEARDLELAQREGADFVFIPSVEEMYPEPTLTKVSVSSITAPLCGASRPGHFDGVTTVVMKLFNIVKPDAAYFGLKDAQQVAVLRRMNEDLNLDIDIVACPIVREADGLALSSRNVYLSAEERREALVLSRSLREAYAAIESGAVSTAEEAGRLLRGRIAASPAAVIDYVEVLSFPGLEAIRPDQTLQDVEGEVIMALAVKFGRTRLIDNIVFTPKEVPACV
ncbi:pantoate--beta-alanine ligase [Paenibacillus sp. CN-4]|uniref:pantoate--beta-alanine ligase n=1 Tax=Paenibacillus nanchangensis TaxID=3348343 RepID=UPI00397C7022